jgi:methylated-DNA-protein-cysteine methyltransferase-like protein
MRHGTLEDLWNIVRSIPSGKVMSYGEVGALLPNPTNGRMVGRWMAQAPDGVPWWRVVAKDGRLPIAKRGPGFASEQEERLQNEGTPFLEGGRVDMRRAAY